MIFSIFSSFHEPTVATEKQQLVDKSKETWKDFQIRNRFWRGRIWWFSEFRLVAGEDFARLVIEHEHRAGLDSIWCLRCLCSSYDRWTIGIFGNSCPNLKKIYSMLSSRRRSGPQWETLKFLHSPRFGTFNRWNWNKTAQKSVKYFEKYFWYCGFLFVFFGHKFLLSDAGGFLIIWQVNSRIFFWEIDTWNLENFNLQRSGTLTLI